MPLLRTESSLPDAAPIAQPAEGVEARIGEHVAAVAVGLIGTLHARRTDRSDALSKEITTHYLRDLVLIHLGLKPDQLASFEATARRHGSAQLRAFCPDISDNHVDIFIDGVLEILGKVIKAVAH
jgi:hypothetical protein